MTAPTLLDAARPIVEENLTMEQEFRTRMLELTRALPILGAGTPEGIQEGLQYQLYIDTTLPAVPSAIEYRKMASDIGGDKLKGWVLV